jgi:hypothetical protein
VFEYVERFYNAKTPTLDNRLHEPHGVRVTDRISLSGCHPNRAGQTEQSTPKLVL